MSYAACMPSNPFPSSVEFQPVMFLFFDDTADVGPQAQAIFCASTLKLYDVVAVADLATGSLLGVEALGEFSKENNVTSDDGPLEEHILNG